jgi:3D (Asp-Asp-Asp) domain-containing protein
VRRLIQTLLIASASLWSVPSIAQWNLPAPTRLPSSDRSYVWSTHYYVHPARPATAPNAVALLDRNGRRLGVALSPRDYCYAAMEGTVAVISGGQSTIFNAAGVGPTQLADCTPFFPRSGARVAIGKQRFVKVGSDAPWGLGTAGYRLVPFRTIATDRGFIQSGTVLYLPRLRGMRFTNSDNHTIIHDGYVFAADVGGSIKRCHIDFFGGGQGDTRFFPFTSDKRHPRALEAYVIRDRNVIARLHRAHTIRPIAERSPGVAGCRSSTIKPQED